MFKPKKLSEFVGNKAAVSSFLISVKNWTKKSKPVLLLGPVGVGKNTLVELVAKELDYEVYEVNASDYRDAESIKDTVGQALRQASWRKGKIILVDEIDALTIKDRGCIQALSDVAKGSRFPVVFTSNSLDRKTSGLKRSCQVMGMERVPYDEVAALLKRLSKQKQDETVLRSLARRSGGDVRSAVIDFETLSSSGRIGKKDLGQLDSRDRAGSMDNTLKIIFKTKDAKTAKEALDTVDLRPEEMIWWVEENAALEYSGKDLAAAFDSLSKADIVLRRIRKRQAWSLLKYYLDLISSGIALSKTTSSDILVKYRKPNRGFFFGRMKYASAELDLLAEELSPKLHCSKAEFKKDYGFLIKALK